MSPAYRLFVPLLLATLVGCSEIPKRDPAKAGPFFTPANTTRLGRLPAEVRRVIILPSFGGPQITEESLNNIDTAVAEELNRTGRFETTVITRDELHLITGQRALSSTGALPPDLFEKLIKAHAADGVLFTDITSFSAYPPLVLGLRMKLAQFSDQQILWAADNVFSGADQAVANSARRHALQLGADRGPGDLSHTILQNPSRFAGYAAAATFQTLPVR